MTTVVHVRQSSRFIGTFRVSATDNFTISRHDARTTKPDVNGEFVVRYSTALAEFRLTLFKFPAEKRDARHQGAQLKLTRIDCLDSSIGHPCRC